MMSYREPIRESKRLKKAAYRTRRKARRLSRLLSAALLIPGLAISGPAAAQQQPGAAEVRFQWASYRDYQRGSQGGTEDRIDVEAPMMYVRAPLGSSTEVEASGVIDSVSGASPFYLDSLSGASGTGIEDRRTAGDVKVTQFFERFSLGGGYARSVEDDYISNSGLLEARWWTADKNTAIAASTSFDSDRITSTNNQSIDQTRHTPAYLVGVTQVLSSREIMQSNIAYQSAQGYLSDPYKLLDSRPRSRDSFGLLNRYNRYIDSINSSLHADYRIAHDSFGITSHTFEVALYKPFATTWLVRPQIRYYSQSQASFYSSTFPPQDFQDGFYSADGRLGAFGGVTVGVKIEHDLGDGYSINASADYLEQRPGWVLGGNGSAGVKRFYAPFFSAGITKQF